MHWTSGIIPWEFSHLFLDVMVQDEAKFLQPLHPLRMLIQLAGRREKGYGFPPPKKKTSALFFTLQMEKLRLRWGEGCA